MGGLILVLLMTGIVCGGVPLLAFAYINGKRKSADGGSPRTTGKAFEAGASHPKALLCAALVLGVFFGCFAFPAFNLTKDFSLNIRLLTLSTAVLAHYELGVIEAAAFPPRKGAAAKTVLTLLGFNCVHILAGMGCRYLLEYGEVSNTYNFTVPNMALHLLAANAVCLVSWYHALGKRS